MKIDKYYKNQLTAKVEKNNFQKNCERKYILKETNINKKLSQYNIANSSVGIYLYLILRLQYTLKNVLQDYNIIRRWLSIYGAVLLIIYNQSMLQTIGKQKTF